LPARYLTLALFLLAGLVGCSAPALDSPQPSGGVLDLRGCDFASGTSVPLTGSWDFLPGTVDIPLTGFMASPYVQRKVPDLWKGTEAGGSRGHGSGSYHLTVLLPPHAPPLAFHYLSASTAFRIEVDGLPIVQVGVPSSDPEAAVPAYKPGFARLGGVGQRLEIMVRVSNYAYRVGGLWFPIFLGSAESIESTHLSEIVIAIGQSMALAIMGLLLLLLFYLRRKDLAFLFGGLMAVILALRLLVTGEYVLTDIAPGISFDLVIRLEYLTVFSSFPVATAFFTALFPRLMDRRLKWACILPSAAFSLLILVLPLDALTRTLIAFYAFAIFNIIVLEAALFLNTIQMRKAEGVAIFAGTILLAASVVNDFLYSSFVWWTGNLVPWGFSAFVALMVVIMVRRMTTAFAGAESLLAQKELMIKEIHHRVKNSLQVVASLLSLQSHRIEDPGVKATFAALRLRVSSMSLVHEKLYGKAASDRLDLGDYLQDLIRLLVSKDGIEPGKIRLSVATEAAEIDADACFDVGLIVTELVSNAMKHAILPEGEGSLKVEMRAEGAIASILVEDEGPGFPPLFDPAASNSLGYKLVASLVKGRRGKLEILPGPGGRVRVEVGLRR
jgi:two-component sensor histidine kinase